MLNVWNILNRGQIDAGFEGAAALNSSKRCVSNRLAEVLMDSHIYVGWAFWWSPIVRADRRILRDPNGATVRCSGEFGRMNEAFL